MCLVRKYVCFQSSKARVTKLATSTFHIRFQPPPPRVSPFRSLNMSTRESKRQKTSSNSNAPYELFYWPGIPGRGEPIRLCFEETGTPYTDVCNRTKDGVKALRAYTDPSNAGEGYNPPVLAPPLLRHGDLLLSQLPNILLYLGPRLNLVPDGEQDEHATYRVNQLALTALDGLSNEAHDTHHPIAIVQYYEDQKEEAKRKATDYIQNRLPKFLGYFERALKSEASQGGEWLYGGNLSYADLVLFHTVDGVSFAFPKAVEQLKKSGKYEGVFGLVERIRSRENIKKYLESDRRQKYSMGIYRKCFPIIHTRSVLKSTIQVTTQN